MQTDSSVRAVLISRLRTWLMRHAGSIRTQLIVWNVVALSIMLAMLGIVCRFITLQVIIGSVNEELSRSVAMYRRPPHFGPPPGPRPGDNRSHGQPEFHQGSGPPPGGVPGNGPGPNRDSHGPGKGPEPGPHHGPDPGHRPPDAGNMYRPHLFTLQGSSIMVNDARQPWDKKGLNRAIHGETLYSDVTVGDEPLRILSAPAFSYDDSRCAVQVAYPLKEVYRAASGITLALLILAPIGLIGAGWVGIALTRRVLNRVHTMTMAAGELGGSDASFSARLPVAGSDEFSELAQTFNGLLSGLDMAYQKQSQSMQVLQRFTADASHELKTPLTIIRGRATMALMREGIDAPTEHSLLEIENAANAMDRLVQDLLLLARYDEGSINSERTSILPVVPLLQQAVSETAGAGMRIRINSPDINAIAACAIKEDTNPIVVAGCEQELGRLFRNLIENAVKYSPEDADVVVEVRSNPDTVTVAVTDTGVGIAREALEHLGERFYRVDASRTRPTGGTGLGLSICKSIVQAHGGTIEFQSVPGQGTTVTVHLPTHG